MSFVLFLASAFCLGGSIVASVLTRKYKRDLREQSAYWEKYWREHYEYIRETGLSREQMERMHRLYADERKQNDL